MNRKLSFYETIIIEEILNGAKSVTELKKRLRINLNLIINTVSFLMKEHYIYLKENEYAVNKELIRKNLAEFKSIDTNEIFELLKCGEYEKSDKIYCQKVYLSDSQANYLYSMFINIQDYLKEVNQSNKNNILNKSLESRHLIYWGNVAFPNITKKLYA